MTNEIWEYNFHYKPQTLTVFALGKALSSSLTLHAWVFIVLIQILPKFALKRTIGIESALDNCLTSDRRLTIKWANDDPIRERIYASSGTLPTDKQFHDVAKEL